ncbi:MAG TPA: GNAT family protein [Flavobacteriales bacterium]|nr:GNAT family protein [Flavobacteriales bacterium]
MAMTVDKETALSSLRSGRIHLRILARTDIPKTTAWINSDRISDIMGYLPVMSLEQQYEWYDRLKNDRTRYIFAICRNDDDVHIGNVALGNVDMVNRHGMFSIFLAEGSDRSKGLGTEATRLLLGFAFDRLNLNKVYLRTSVRFEQAIRMYEKLGFKHEGTMRDHSYSNGVYEEKLIYSILRSEFDTTKSRP